MAGGFYPFGGGGSKSFSPFPTYKSTSPLTAQQRMQLNAAKKAAHSQSFVDRLKNAGSSGLHTVSWTFDKLLRPEYAIATALDKGASYHHFDFGAAAHGAREGFMGRGDKGFGQVLANHGVLSGHARLRGLAGFGLDVGLDPLTYVTGGTSLAAKTAEHAALIKAGKVAISHSGKGDTAALKAAADILGQGGKSYEFRHALAKAHLDTVGKEMTPIRQGRLAVLRESALAEQGRVEKRLPYYNIGIGKHKVKITPTTVAGKQVVPALPKLDNAIKRGGLLGSMADSYSNKFVRAAHTTPETHAMGITAQHLGEQYTNEMLHNVQALFSGVSKLRHADQLNLLHHFETASNAVIKTKKGNYVLNEGLISKLLSQKKITSEQVKFLRSWHKATEYLSKRDKSFGVQYEHLGEKGKLYVPHKLVDKYGHPLADVQINALTKAGFQKGRQATDNLSVKMLDTMQKEGKLGRTVETNPYNLLIQTTRARAKKQADMTLLHSITPTMGTSTRLVDEAKLAKVFRGRETLTQKIAATEAKHTAALSDAHTKEQLFLANHEMVHNEKASALEAQIRKHKFGRNKPTKAATMAKLQNRLDKLNAVHAAETKAIAKGKHEPVNAIVGEHVAEAAAHANDIKNMQAELKNLGKTEAKIRQGTKNPAYSETHTVTVSGAVDAHGHPLAFEPDLAHAIEKYQKIVSGDDKAIEDFSRGWRKWLATWKLAVTSVNPGYRIRNSQTDFWNMYLAGVPINGAVRYGAKAAKMMRAAKTGDPKAMEFLTEAYHHGILSGLYQGDIQAIAKMIEYQGSKKSLAQNGRFLKLATKIAQDANANAENWGRLTHYMYRKQVLGESTADAAAKVKMAHFDYEDLTPFEQKVMKGIAPFYTWSRKNIPYQIKQVFASPGRYATAPKAMIESEQAAGGDKGNIVPGYIPDNFGFQIPFGKHNYYLPQMGFSDLQAVDNPKGPLQRAGSLLNPALQVPIELAMNKNLYTGQDIAGPNHPRNPVSNLGAALAALVPGGNVGPTSRLGEGGKQFAGPGADPKLAFLMQQLPLGNELLIKGPGSLKRGSNPIPPEVSYLGGQSVQHVDPKLQNIIAQINLQDKIKKEVGGQKDSGLVRRKRKKVSAHQALINKQIAFSSGRK